MPFGSGESVPSAAPRCGGMLLLGRPSKFSCQRMIVGVATHVPSTRCMRTLAADAVASRARSFPRRSPARLQGTVGGRTAMIGPATYSARFFDHAAGAASAAVRCSHDLPNVHAPPGPVPNRHHPPAADVPNLQLPSTAHVARTPETVIRVVVREILEEGGTVEVSKYVEWNPVVARETRRDDHRYGMCSVHVPARAGKKVKFGDTKIP